jgi:hypothetical protein
VSGEYIPGRRAEFVPLASVPGRSRRWT